MKIYSIFLILPILFSGCAHKSAFDAFHITTKEQLAQEQILTAKMRNDKNITGLVAVLYLNNVDKKQFNEYEYFYVSLFVQNVEGKTPQFLLNSKAPLQIEKLTNKNRFTKLTALNAAWMDYYLLTFQKEKEDLKFEVKENGSTSGVLRFKQEQ